MGTTAVNRQPTGAVSSRARVLQALRDVPGGRGVHELASDLRLHPNTVRFHLDRLEQEGMVRRRVGHQRTPGRPPLTFTAVPQPERSDDRRDFRELAELLAQILADRVPGAGDLSEQAGRSWAQRLSGLQTEAAPGAAEALSMLADALAGVGFDPQVTSDRHQLSMLQRRCPFLEIAKEHRDVVCSIQLGLIRGVLERLGAPVEVTRLIPFASPNGCLVQFSER